MALGKRVGVDKPVGLADKACGCEGSRRCVWEATHGAVVREVALKSGTQAGWAMGIIRVIRCLDGRVQ